MDLRDPAQRAAVYGFVVILALLAAVCLNASPSRAQEVYTPQDTLDAIDEAAAEIGVDEVWLYDVVGCETGWTFNPYAVGRQGELGAAQLHPRGELRRFFSWGYLDPFSPYQAVRFLAQRKTMGGAGAWSCAR